jgi:hypothetical protein
MKQREFEIRIAPDGTVEVEVKGFKGKRCLDAVKVFEQMIGEIQSRRLTTEYYDPEEDVQYHVEQRY